ALIVPALGAGAGVAAARGAHGHDGDGHGSKGPGSPSSLTVSDVLSGKGLSHTFTTQSGSKSEPLSKPDDLTLLGNEIFVAFQNGVGAQGEPASDGNTASTVVGFSPAGKVMGQWDVTGKIDGMVADPVSATLIATVNEDANSSLYVIDPAGAKPQHYTYDQNPLPHNGGTDSIAVVGGRILISASAPGTASAANSNPPAAPQAQYPAVYSVSLNPQTSTAYVSPLFFGKSTAVAANTSHQGSLVTLGLTDPDSSTVVPEQSPRFANDFVLDSQGDQQQIYVSDAGGPAQKLSVLSLDQSIDDTAWATASSGTLYASDSVADTVVAITGRFRVGTAFVAVTPCGASTAPSNCSTPNSLGTLDLFTGHVSAVPLPSAVSTGGGLLFLGDGGRA
ncbi:MAG TPA: hypothetical protein VFN61_00870, partial [Acidimicrobiales bacterium]|nr:hypothetical protein [Acidimicrobiales bacterium]